MIKYISIFFALILLVGCAPVEQYSRISQPMDTQLTAGVGDTVLNVYKEKNFPNVFGASDIFGRKTPTGMTTVQYLGVRSGKAFFKRKSVFIETGATTMNSTPVVIQNSSTTIQSGMIGGMPYSGVSSTAAPPMIIPPNTPPAQFMDEGALMVSVDLGKKTKQLIVEGKTLTIESADSTKVVYSISE